MCLSPDHAAITLYLFEFETTELKLSYIFIICYDKSVC